MAHVFQRMLWDTLNIHFNLDMSMSFLETSLRRNIETNLLAIEDIGFLDSNFSFIDIKDNQGFLLLFFQFFNSLYHWLII